MATPNLNYSGGGGDGGVDAIFLILSLSSLRFEQPNNSASFHIRSLRLQMENMVLVVEVDFMSLLMQNFVVGMFEMAPRRKPDICTYFNKVCKYRCVVILFTNPSF